MQLNPFGKKKKAADDFGAGGAFGPSAGPRPPERKIVPSDEVRALSSRGVSEPDIIRSLRREGYSTTEIDQAMKDALRSRVSGDFYNNRPAVNEYGEAPLGPPPENMPARDEIPRGLGYPGADTEDEDIPPPPYDQGAGMNQPARETEYPEMPDEYPQPLPRRPVARPAKGMDRKEIEELTEVIVEEKLRDVRDRFRGIEAQFQQTARKMDSIADEIGRIRADKSGEIKGIESKIDNYYKGMESMSGRMESMEKALRDSLSPMLESLRSLSELVRSMKEKAK